MFGIWAGVTGGVNFNVYGRGEFIGYNAPVIQITLPNNTFVFEGLGIKMRQPNIFPPTFNLSAIYIDQFNSTDYNTSAIIRIADSIESEIVLQTNPPSPQTYVNFLFGIPTPPLSFASAVLLLGSVGSINN